MAAWDRRRGGGGSGGAAGDVSWSRFFWCTIFAVLSCVLFTVFAFSTLRLSLGETFQPVAVPSWRNPAMRAISGDSEPAPSVLIRETVIFPDQAVIFLKYPPSSRLFTREDIHCIYVAASDSAKLWLKQPPAGVDRDDSGEQIVRCPLAENGSLVSHTFESDEHVLPGPSHRCDSLVYEAVIDRGNTTVVSTSDPNASGDVLKFRAKALKKLGTIFQVLSLLRVERITCDMRVTSKQTKLQNHNVLVT